MSKKQTVTRMDYWGGESPDQDWFTKAMKPDANGFLKGRAYVTNIGVFSYAIDGGGTRKELRLPEEVFDEKSLASLQGLPLTLDHPAKGVTPATYKDLAVGSVGDDIRTDAYRISAGIVISRDDALQAVKDGTTALSCAYSCLLDPTPGTWMGVEYDVIQRDIRYNHVALVDVPRAGDDAKLRMDGAGELIPGTDRTDQSGQPVKPTSKEERMNKFHFDGKEISTEAEAVSALTELKLKADAKAKDDESKAEQIKELEAQIEKLKGELDSAKDELEEEKKKAEDKADSFPSAISEAVAKRLALVTQAQDAGAEVKADMSDADIKAAVIKHAFPSAELDGKSAEYIGARFDSALEILAARKADAKDTADASAAQKADASDAGRATKTDSLEDARAKMIAENLNAYQRN